MKIEKTLVLIKPGMIERGIIGDIIHRFEKKGLFLLALKMEKPTKSQFNTLYQEHREKKFYKSLLDYMQSGYIISMIVGGVEAVKICRTLIGNTNPIEALPGSIRGDYGYELTENVVHASDSLKSAAREIKIFFSPSEIRKI